MRALRVALVLWSVAASDAVRGQEAVSAEVPRERVFVRTTDATSSTRRAQLEAVRAAIRTGVAPADYAARLAALEAVAAPGLERIAGVVTAAGGRVVQELPKFAAALVELPASAVARLRDDPTVLDVTTECTHGPHIKRSTNGNNHAADQVQAAWTGCRGQGATLALLDSGIDADCAPTGLPHPAFVDPTRGDASRIVATRGFASAADTEDRIGHGTSVAGVAVARRWDTTPNSDDGFAPAAAVASYKITSGALASYADGNLVAAIDAIATDRVQLHLGTANLSWAGVPSSNHFVAQTLDELVHFFDVVLVVSAGNDGDLPNPTARSQGSANALAVAALVADSHVVWEQSTYGPLLGDPERLWPDLAAVGVDMRTPWPDRPVGTSLLQSGTSFAAPAVSGTATLLRGTRPDLDGRTTRALLLATTQDIAAANPGRGRLNYGLGMLRTDLAFDALQHGSRFHGRVTPAAPVWETTIEPAPNRELVVCLVWDRIDVFRPDWDDLDLEVVAPDGRVLGVSTTPRNLYERVVFLADQPGSYRCVVRARTLVNPEVDFALVTTDSRGGLRQPGTFDTFGQGCAGYGVDAAQGVLLPTFAAGRFGTAKLALPLGGAPGRILQIVDGRSLPTDLTVRALGLRRDEGTLDIPAWRVDLRIRMGHTTRAPSAPSITFDANFDGDGEPVPVFDQRGFDLPGAAGLPQDPRLWDFVIPLDRPFVPRCANGQNVVVDFQLLAHSRGNAPFGLFLDAELDLRTATVSAIADPHATTGIADPVGLQLSLLDERTFATVPRIDADGTPQLQSTLHVTLRDARPSGIAALVHGGSGESWGTAALPLGLDWLGAPGCTLLARPDLLLPAPIGPNGQATVPIRVPALPSVTGTVFFEQFLVLDPRANPLGLATSAGAFGRVGM